MFCCPFTHLPHFTTRQSPALVLSERAKPDGGKGSIDMFDSLSKPKKTGFPSCMEVFQLLGSGHHHRVTYAYGQYSSNHCSKFSSDQIYGFLHHTIHQWWSYPTDTRCWRRGPVGLVYTLPVPFALCVP